MTEILIIFPLCPSHPDCNTNAPPCFVMHHYPNFFLFLFFCSSTWISPLYLCSRGLYNWYITDQSSHLNDWMIDCLYGISTLHGSFNAEIVFVLKSRGVQWVNGFGYFDHHLITLYDMNSSQLTDDEQLTADCFIMWTDYISPFPEWMRSTCSWKFSFIYLFASLPFSLLVNTWMVTLKISHLDITVGYKIPVSKKIFTV